MGRFTRLSNNIPWNTDISTSDHINLIDIGSSELIDPGIHPEYRDNYTYTKREFITPLSNLPTLTTAQSTPAGETCVSTATSTQCALGPNPSETACVTNTYCVSFAPTAVTTSSTAAPTPTGQVYIDIYTDSDCINVLEQTILNVIGQCYSPTDSKGNPITFACFALTYISTAASNSADLIAYKDGGCFA